MPRFAIYEPHEGDPLSGPIVQITRKRAADMGADARAFVEVPDDMPADLDATHAVLGGAIVPKAE